MTITEHPHAVIRCHNYEGAAGIRVALQDRGIIAEQKGREVRVPLTEVGESGLRSALRLPYEAIFEVHP